MGLFTFLLIVQTLIAAAMIAVILMQRSEGGGLVSGGGGSSLMSARGAADFLTRSTAILATLFVILSIILAGVAAGTRTPRTIDPGLYSAPPAGTPAEQQPTPFTGEQIPIPGTKAPAAQQQQPAEQPEGKVPLAQ